jgi:hypothetical protein
VQVEDSNVFPADLVLLSSAHPEGVCYIETMNLDGETNLKLKKVPVCRCSVHCAAAASAVVCVMQCRFADTSLASRIMQALPQTWDYSLANDVVLAAPGSSSIECEQPNNSLYTFTGNLQLGQQKLPLTTNQVRRRLFCALGGQTAAIYILQGMWSTSCVQLPGVAEGLYAAQHSTYLRCGDLHRSPNEGKLHFHQTLC